MNYYNEHDPNAAAWLRELISYGAIPNGHVDTRSIRDVQPSDLSGYTQCHFFAGIGGWSYALRLAGWPENRLVWTGSCPCQPFSSAGKQRGTADERHLWPEFFRLIRECKPPVVFGEQVASPVALDWLDAVSADLEGAGYAVGAADLCAAGIGAPHIRQRLYWVADALHAGRPERRPCSGDRPAAGSGCDGSLGNTLQPGLEGHRSGPATKTRRDGAVRPIAEASESCGVGNTYCTGRETCDSVAIGTDESPRESSGSGLYSNANPTNGFWRDADWLFCRDGKWRPVEPGAFPLAHGVPARVGRLRGYGNAIVPQVAAEFIKAAVQD